MIAEGLTYGAQRWLKDVLGRGEKAIVDEHAWGKGKRCGRKGKVLSAVRYNPWKSKAWNQTEAITR
jgi:hypothetical protein